METISIQYKQKIANKSAENAILVENDTRWHHRGGQGNVHERPLHTPLHRCTVDILGPRLEAREVPTPYLAPLGRSGAR